MIKQNLFSKSTNTLFFHILTECNLNCKHCYINPDQHGHLKLDIKTIISWLKIFINKNKKMNVVFLGGEPTIHPDLHIAINKAKELGYNSISLDTNGYKISKLLNILNPSDLNILNFSLDGSTSKINDNIRGKGSYNCCINAINKSKKKGFNVGLIFTLSMANLFDLKEMPTLLHKLKIDHFYIQVIGIRGKWINDNKTKKMLNQVNSVLWTEFINNSTKKILKMGIQVTYPKVFLKPNETFECLGLLENNYFLFPNGRVYTCPLCQDYPLHSKIIKEKILITKKNFNETALFDLNIPEGCVMNKIIQPGNIEYDKNGLPKHKISCCMIKERLEI